MTSVPAVSMGSSTSVYDWSSSPEDPSYYKRQAWGAEIIEDVWNRYNHGEQKLFLGADVTATKPVQSASLLAYARDAWISLRFELPIIAAHTEQDADDITLIHHCLGE
ncbi:hypothetical protein B0H10DRAFT_1945973 [Mycena sp. CBHHK59/15]|nr:hypothetical protein B0H10DRAFT_1945973 [Mycena sp. CBHHK59/15]